MSWLSRCAVLGLLGLVACGDDGTDGDSTSRDGGGGGSVATPTRPAFQVQRIDPPLATDKLARLSRGNVSHTRLTSHRSRLDLKPVPGAKLEFELAPAGAGTGAMPDAVTLELTRNDATQTLTAESLGMEGDGPRSWHRYRVDLSDDALRGTWDAQVHIGGAALTPGQGWACSTPRLYQALDDPRFNVLFITVDTLRADTLGCYGYDQPTTPRLDQFAKQSMRFTQCLSQASWTLPSYASMLTSLYGGQHGVVHRNQPLPRGYITFPELFAEDGYTTGGFVSGTFTDKLWGFDQGFDSYDDLGMVVNDNEALVDGVDPTEGAAMVSAEKRVTSDVITDRALGWLDQHQDDRFLLFAHYFDPHSDFVEQDGFTERFPARPASTRIAMQSLPPSMDTDHDGTPDAVDPGRIRQLYDGEVAFTDHHIGRLLDGLDDRGLRDDTIVVFCADHGEDLYDRIRIGHGHSLFAELVHVPLMIDVPGLEDGAVCEATVGNVDLGPTLLELCGLVPMVLPPHAGRSVAGLLTGELKTRGAAVLSEQFPGLRPSNFPDDRPFSDLRNSFRLDLDGLQLIELQRGRRVMPFLFDASADPFQTRNLIPERPDDAKALSQAASEAKQALQALYNPSEAMDLSEDLNERLSNLGYTGEPDKPVEVPDQEDSTTPDDATSDGGVIPRR